MNRHTDVENRCVNMRQRRKGNDELGGRIDIYTQGLPLWLSWERICLQCGRPRFDPRVGKIPWRRERLPTPVFWPGEFHGVYSLWDHKESGVAFISQSCIYTLSQSVSSVAQSFPTLCDPMNRSTLGLLVHHQLPEFIQIHAHWVGDAIQPSHPLSSPSPTAPNPSQHQGLFQWVSSSHEVAKVLEFQLQHQSFQWTPRIDLLQGWTGWISLPSKGLSKVFSNTTVQKYQFFGAQLSSQSNSHIHTWPL